MLRHVGQRRTYKHNLRLAVLLCLTAGFVNVVGLMTFSVLTTNITGHAATLAVDLEGGHVMQATIALGWLSLFLGGALFSSWYIGFMGKHKRYAYTVPLLIEFCVLCFVALRGNMTGGFTIRNEYLAGSLLFVMGMQNALVTVISKSVVRTTHLTGIITDFGISLSSAILARFRVSRGLRQRLVLQGNIILSFLIGGVFGAFSFRQYLYYSFLIPAGIIVGTIFFDAFRVGYLRLRHHYLGIGR